MICNYGYFQGKNTILKMFKLCINLGIYVIMFKLCTKLVICEGDVFILMTFVSRRKISSGDS